MTTNSTNLFCTRCGERLGEGHAFCSGCGFSVRPIMPPPPDIEKVDYSPVRNSVPVEQSSVRSRSSQRSPDRFSAQTIPENRPMDVPKPRRNVWPCIVGVIIMLFSYYRFQDNIHNYGWSPHYPATMIYHNKFVVLVALADSFPIVYVVFICIGAIVTWYGWRDRGW